MARKQHNLDEVLSSLKKKNDCRIIEKSIFMLTGTSPKPQFKKQNDLGNGSWGKIDYLTRVHKYRIVYTSEY